MEINSEAGQCLIGIGIRLGGSSRSVESDGRIGQVPLCTLSQEGSWQADVMMEGAVTEAKHAAVP